MLGGSGMKKETSVQRDSQKDVVRTFREAGAFSVELSKSLSDMGLSESMVFRKLVRNGVIVHAGSRTYFLDEKQWLGYRMNRVKWGLIVLFSILLVLFVWLFRVV
jgi:hypothetical protein